MWIIPSIVSIFCVACTAAVIIHLLRVGRDGRRWQRSLAARTATVNRLLDFSQIIEGTSKPDQVIATLTHFLRTELDLAGLSILTQNAMGVPSIQLQGCWPSDCVSASVCDMDPSLCPCLRQNLPRQFRPNGAPIRCPIEASLKLDSSHPAYCIPFNFGHDGQNVVHMLAPPNLDWTEERRQLAQTYVNSAQAALANLHLLAEAEKQSMTDPLTNLFNRRSMEPLLLREVALAERHHHALSVVMIDVDHFKAVNDTHGHAAGDYLLKSLAACVQMTLRKTDLAFRYGGDEFLIALPQTTLAQAQQVVQKLRQAFTAIDFSDAIANMKSNPTLSMGLAERSIAIGVLALTQLLAAADSALYCAKEGERNCTRVYEPPKAA